MKKHATALRAFTHADDSFGKGDPIHLDAGQFTDWESAGLVRAATDAEIARAKGEPAEKPARTAPKRKAKATAKPTETPAAPVVDPDPAAPAA